MARKRYQVEWTPWADVHAAAVRRGMPPDGEVSDYVAIESFDRGRVFPNFGLALAFAKKVVPDDTWHCPRIRRQFLAPNDHDDLGNRVEPMPSWENEATWEVFEDAPAPVESAPDWLAAA